MATFRREMFFVREGFERRTATCELCGKPMVYLVIEPPGMPDTWRHKDSRSPRCEGPMGQPDNIHSEWVNPTPRSN